MENAWKMRKKRHLGKSCAMLKKLLGSVFDDQATMVNTAHEKKSDLGYCSKGGAAT